MRQPLPVTQTALPRPRVERAYRRLAVVYDYLFGAAFDLGRRLAVRRIRLEPGARVLEVGVGTALTAELFPRWTTVVGVDLSRPMLRRAADRLSARRTAHVRLAQMDAVQLAFPPGLFDVVYAAYVLTAVPDPVAVLREMQRVCRPGGQLVIVNHFTATSWARSRIDRLLAPLTARLGFRTDLALEPLLQAAGVPPHLVRRERIGPVWTLASWYARPE